MEKNVKCLWPYAYHIITCSKSSVTFFFFFYLVLHKFFGMSDLVCSDLLYLKPTAMVSESTLSPLSGCSLLVVSQLTNHLNRNRRFQVFQSGFRAETALIKVVNDLFMASDSGLVFVLILLDLSTVVQNIQLTTYS